MTFAWIFALLMFVAGSGVARAATFSATLCVNYAVGFADASATVGDDFLTSLADVPARGAYIYVQETGHGGAIVAAGFADESGTNLGCLSAVPVVTGNGYAIHLKSEAFIGGNTVEVRRSITNSNHFNRVWYWTPADDSTKTVTTDLGDQWNIMAAAGEAAGRLSGGLSGETWRWYNQNCPTSAFRPNCIGHLGSPDDLWVAFACDTVDPATCPLESAASRHKYELGHQMGHLASIFSTPITMVASVDSSALPGGDCSGGARGVAGHMMNSDEYQSQAAYEGMADTWAAMAYNNFSTETDCRFASYTPVDWNNDESSDNNMFDCGGGDLCLSPECMSTIDGADYQGDECGGLTGHAVEVDWLRFWWTLVADYGLSDADVMSIWGGASPYDWYAGGSDTGIPSSDQPPQRLRASAVPAYVYGTTWDSDASAQGVDR